jgi:cell division protein ZapA
MAETRIEGRRPTGSVSVDIYDQTYHLRAQDPEYIEKLADMVDSKMRAVSANGHTVDSLRVAVLAALNIADELMRLQEHCRQLHGTMSETQTVLRSRANNLSGLLDSVLSHS